MLDTSKDMGGTFQVTMHDGLLALKNELGQQMLLSPLVYLSLITFGGQMLWHRLRTPKFFEPPVWHAEGRCMLKPAIERLTKAVEEDLMANRPDRAGDYTPLVFLVLGSHPVDNWQKSLGGIMEIYDNRAPQLIAVVTRPDLLPEMKGISDKLFLLKPAKAIFMTKCFFWITQSIIKISEDYSRGATTITFPDPPSELIPY
jgi:uncharacterized protein YegL